MDDNESDLNRILLGRNLEFDFFFFPQSPKFRFILDPLSLKMKPKYICIKPVKFKLEFITFTVNFTPKIHFGTNKNLIKHHNSCLNFHRISLEVIKS